MQHMLMSLFLRFFIRNVFICVSNGCWNIFMISPRYFNHSLAWGSSQLLETLARNQILVIFDLYFHVPSPEFAPNSPLHPTN